MVEGHPPPSAVVSTLPVHALELDIMFGDILSNCKCSDIGEIDFSGPLFDPDAMLDCSMDEHDDIDVIDAQLSAQSQYDAINDTAKTANNTTSFVFPSSAQSIFHPIPGTVPVTSSQFNSESPPTSQSPLGRTPDDTSLLISRLMNIDSTAAPPAAQLVLPQVTSAQPTVLNSNSFSTSPPQPMSQQTIHTHPSRPAFDQQALSSLIDLSTAYVAAQLSSLTAPLPQQHYQAPPQLQSASPAHLCAPQSTFPSLAPETSLLQSLLQACSNETPAIAPLLQAQVQDTQAQAQAQVQAVHPTHSSPPAPTSFPPTPHQPQAPPSNPATLLDPLHSQQQSLQQVILHAIAQSVLLHPTNPQPTPPQQPLQNLPLTPAQLQAIQQALQTPQTLNPAPPTPNTHDPAAAAAQILPHLANLLSLHLPPGLTSTSPYPTTNSNPSCASLTLAPAPTVSLPPSTTATTPVNSAAPCDSLPPHQQTLPTQLSPPTGSVLLPTSCAVPPPTQRGSKRHHHKSIMQQTSSSQPTGTTKPSQQFKLAQISAPSPSQQSTQSSAQLPSPSSMHTNILQGLSQQAMQAALDLTIPDQSKPTCHSQQNSADSLSTGTQSTSPFSASQVSTQTPSAPLQLLSSSQNLIDADVSRLVQFDAAPAFAAAASQTLPDQVPAACHAPPSQSGSSQLSNASGICTPPLQTPQISTAAGLLDQGQQANQNAFLLPPQLPTQSVTSAPAHCHPTSSATSGGVGLPPATHLPSQHAVAAAAATAAGAAAMKAAAAAAAASQSVLQSTYPLQSPPAGMHTMAPSRQLPGLLSQRLVESILEDPMSGTRVAAQLCLKDPATFNSRIVTCKRQPIRYKQKREELQREMDHTLRQLEMLAITNQQLRLRDRVLNLLMEAADTYERYTQEVKSEIEEYKKDPSRPAKGAVLFKRMTLDSFMSLYRQDLSDASNYVIMEQSGRLSPEDEEKMAEANRENVRNIFRLLTVRPEIFAVATKEMKLLLPPDTSEEEHWIQATLAMNVTEEQEAIILAAAEVFKRCSAKVDEDRDGLGSTIGATILSPLTIETEKEVAVEDPVALVRQLKGIFKKQHGLVMLMAIFLSEKVFTPLQVCQGALHAHPLLFSSLSCIHAVRVLKQRREALWLEAAEGEATCRQGARRQIC